MTIPPRPSVQVAVAEFVSLAARDPGSQDLEEIHCVLFDDHTLGAFAAAALAAGLREMPPGEGRRPTGGLIPPGRGRGGEGYSLRSADGGIGLSSGLGGGLVGSGGSSMWSGGGGGLYPALGCAGWTAATAAAWGSEPKSTSTLDVGCANSNTRPQHPYGIEHSAAGAALQPAGMMGAAAPGAAATGHAAKAAVAPQPIATGGTDSWSDGDPPALVAGAAAVKGNSTSAGAGSGGLAAGSASGGAAAALLLVGPFAADAEGPAATSAAALEAAEGDVVMVDNARGVAAAAAAPPPPGPVRNSLGTALPPPLLPP